MILSLVVLLAFVALSLKVNAEVQYMSFADLEKDTNMKLVLFHDAKVDASNTALATMTALSNNPEFNGQYLFKVCDLKKKKNKAAKKSRFGWWCSV